MYDICDIHSHVLPGMDDGCKTPEESALVLRQMWADGVKKVFATPHYYARESVSDFLARRAASEQRLRTYLAGMDEPLPALCCGAEVAYFSCIGRCEQLEQLCLGNSRYLLLELPFTPWSSQVVRDVNNLSLQGYIPILAHYQRYTACQSRKMLQRMLESEPLVQMNAGCVLDLWKGPKARAALAQHRVQLLGSDCHDMDSRPSRLGETVALLQKKKMDGVLARIEQLGNEIFRKATADKV